MMVATLQEIILNKFKPLQIYCSISLKYNNKLILTYTATIAIASPCPYSHPQQKGVYPKRIMLIISIKKCTDYSLIHNDLCELTGKVLH